MISIIYIEEDVLDHPTTKKICKQNCHAHIIPIHHYGEIFNRHSQNFRLQKQHPCLILARKNQGFLHPTPPGYGIGKKHNYYFSHVLNCPFDCRYCFLQAMYKSAHYVYFVNQEEYQSEIENLAKQYPNDMTIFTGYDGDSLALDPITGFLDTYYPFFHRLSSVEFELRTKSTAINSLLSKEPLKNVVIAYSMNPPSVAKNFEKKTPSIQSRIEAMKKLQKHGWQIGLRFDPIIHYANAKSVYQEFFEEIFSSLSEPLLHSVSLGNFRMPKGMKKTMLKLLPDDPLIASNQDQMDTLTFCSNHLFQFISQEKIFACT